LFLSLFLATRPAPERFNNALGELLRSASLQRIEEDVPTSWQMLVIFCARQAQQIGGETATHVKAELVNLAHKFATEPAKPDDEPKHERAAILLEAARHLALGQDARIARARSFADTASAFLRAWPACGAHLRRTITFLSFRLPPREAAELRLTRALVLAQPTNAPSTGIL